MNSPTRIGLADLGEEPFRVLFPLGVLSGIVGVSLWPLHLLGVTQFYPGQAHARLMAYGLFGGFIFGFLGTALPRLLSAQPFGLRNVLVVAGLQLGILASLTVHKLWLGDALFLINLCIFAFVMLRRASQRKDLPPPGIILVILAFLSAFIGTILSLAQPWIEETAARWVTLQRLLSFQGFVLLPILGIGPFLLPRFFGLASAHDFPESMAPSARWKKKAALAFGIGLLIEASFYLEMAGDFRKAHALRFAASAVYLILEFPLHRPSENVGALGRILRIAFASLVGGFGLVALFPEFRVSLLHLTLVGGFAMITFGVAIRVVFGHSGNLEKLGQRNRWLPIAVGLMLFGLLSRISGDFWPKIMISHYVYGAISWVAGVLIWSWFVLPNVLLKEPATQAAAKT